MTIMAAVLLAVAAAVLWGSGWTIAGWACFAAACILAVTPKNAGERINSLWVRWKIQKAIKARNKRFKD